MEGANMGLDKYHFACLVDKVWLPAKGYQRGGKVFGVDERHESFEVEIDVDAICEMVARDAAKNASGLSSQMMGLVKARHIRGGVRLAAEGGAG